MLGPIRQGERVSLEPLRVQDLDLVRSWFADPLVTRFWGIQRGYSEKQIEEWYQQAAESAHDIRWRVVVEDKTIGHTIIEHIDWIHRHADTGLMMGDAAAWGKGYATEAVALRTAYAFQDLGLERLGSESVADNLAMHRVLEKAGYQNIGCKRHYHYRDVAWQDLYMFELLRDEWIAHNRVVSGASTQRSSEH